MKKSTLIFITIIYIASIVIISIFGMKSVVYNEVITTTSVECLNQSQGTIQVTENNGVKIIRIPFTEAGNMETLTGTMLQLEWRVAPDNATNNKVKFVYTKNKEAFEFITGEDGTELGLILFYSVCNFNVDIMSTDGTKVYATVTIHVYEY